MSCSMPCLTAQGIDRLLRVAAFGSDNGALESYSWISFTSIPACRSALD